MKICPNCGTRYKDNMIECEECEEMLVPMEGESSRKANGKKSASSQKKRPNSLQPGTRATRATGRSRRIRHGNSFIPRLTYGLWKAVCFLVPVAMIAAGIYMIVLNWASIKVILRCMAMGAIIGSLVLTFLSIKFGRTFKIGVMISGACIGAVLALVFRYNLLDIGTGIETLLYAVGPVIIALIGIWIMIKPLIESK